VLSAAGLGFKTAASFVSRFLLLYKTKPRLNKTRKRMYCFKSEIKPKNGLVIQFGFSLISKVFNPAQT